MRIANGIRTKLADGTFGAFIEAETIRIFGGIELGQRICIIRPDARVRKNFFANVTEIVQVNDSGSHIVRYK